MPKAWTSPSSSTMNPQSSGMTCFNPSPTDRNSSSVKGTKPQLLLHASLNTSTMIFASSLRFFRSIVRMVRRSFHSGRAMMEPLPSRSEARTA